MGTITSDDIKKVFMDDLLAIHPRRPSVSRETFQLDWEHIMNTYDGVELINGNCWNIFRYNGFYSWDCDSIVIWNKEVVKLL